MWLSLLRDLARAELVTASVAYRPCPLCGGTDTTPWEAYSPGEWLVGKCTSCGLTYLRNPVEYEALEEDFAWEKTYVEKKKKGGSTPLSGAIRALRGKLGVTHRSRNKNFEEWFGAGKVLDIGCGDGSRLQEPLVPYGIELSTALHAEADARMRARGGECKHGAGATTIWEFDEGQFDGIVMHSYLEHEVDVMSVLNGSHRALKSGGKIFIRVPNFGSINRSVIGKKWCGFRYPDHVNYFTRASLADAAKRAGFTMEVVNARMLAVDDNIQALFTKIDAPAASGLAA